MVLGIGSGSTIVYAVERIGKGYYSLFYAGGAENDWNVLIKLAFALCCLQLLKSCINVFSRACCSIVYMVLICYNEEKYVLYNGFNH